MKSTIEHIGKTPMQNFNTNFPAMSAAETDGEFVDQLGESVAGASEALMGALDGRSNEELAAICAAFDPAANTCSIFEDMLDAELAKVSSGGEEKKEEKEQEVETPKTKELAFVGEGEGGEKDKKVAIVEQGGDKKEGGGDKEHKIVGMVPDEMKEMAIAQQGHEPGTLKDDKLHHRA
jgi:hypothetical protein